MKPRQRLAAFVCSVALVGGSGACTDFTEPAQNVGVEAPPPDPTPSATAEPAPSATAPTPPTPPAPAPEAQATVSASHILVAYAGALRADPSIKRTKEEAQKRAASLVARAKKGEDFAKLADSASDDPSAKMNHGALGSFTKERMVKPFSDAAFALKPGEIAGPVETPFGFHVIKRTE